MIVVLRSALDPRVELGAFCDDLVERNLLTRWQCDKLLEGRWKGFFMDEFRIYDNVGCDETCSRYAAQRTLTGRHVVLRVTPPHI